MTPSTRPARVTWTLLLVLAVQGFTLALNGVAAPWIRESFGLDEAGLARLFAIVSVSAMGAFLLTGLADRVGRRPVVLACLLLGPVSAAGAAVAGSFTVFAALEVLMLSCAGAGVATSTVYLSEELSTHRRAAGQGMGGIAIGAGSGACIVAMPALLAMGLSWRGLLWLSAAGLLAWPLAFAALPESRLWAPGPMRARPTASAGLFGPAHRRLVVPVLVSGFLSTLVVTTGNAWRYYHAVTVTGLSASAASATLLVASALGLVGFLAGARTSERLGRVPTVAGFALVVTAGLMASYWGPPGQGIAAVLWLGAGFFVFATAANAMTVGGNCSATELFPTEVRGALVGWLVLVGAFGQVAGQSAVALLSDVAGGLSTVVGALSVLAVGVAVVFVAFVDETRGVVLDARDEGEVTWPTLLAPPD